MLINRRDAARICKIGFTSLALVLSPGTKAATFSDPCAGPVALLNIVDRPTVGDSACVVPYKNVVLEMGYQYTDLNNSGNSYNLPEAELRVGLPANTEIAILIPNYIHVSRNSLSGLTAVTMGIKHEFGYNAHWLWSGETLVTLPTGSHAYGSHAVGGAVNGIVSYNYNPQINATFMLGVSNETLSTLAGGARFTSINPVLVLSYDPIPVVSLYVEVYGATKTSPRQGSGSNMDAGVVYLITPKVEIDVEFGHRISGVLGGFNQYVGAGASMMF